MYWTAGPPMLIIRVEDRATARRRRRQAGAMTETTVHTYRAAETGLYVNSYLVEVDSGVLVVDTNLLVSDIEALHARLAALKKPLLGVLVTHAHPDHFNGILALVRDGDVPVYAAATVARAIEEVADAKRTQWSPTCGDEWPTETYYPNSVLADGDVVDLDGISVTVRELGPAESHADSYFLVSAHGGHPVAFIGDVAFHGTHAYTADGHSAAWLTALDVLAGELADVATLYPGHGDPTGPTLLAEQRRYLLYYREVVRRLADGAAQLSDSAKAELDAVMQAFLPGASLTWMIGLGADAVAAELAGQAAVAGL
jgi:glyoxylase-like metal-dependent hydrolase (beta-lactamase superfamily II)